jgi:hypothetical protein
MTAPEPRPKFDLLRVLVAVALASIPVVLWYEGEIRAVREQLDVPLPREEPAHHFGLDTGHPRDPVGHQPLAPDLGLDRFADAHGPRFYPGRGIGAIGSSGHGGRDIGLLWEPRHAGVDVRSMTTESLEDR